ncbi:MAG: hypothetical protein UIK35_10640 [Coprococcus catus]|nr:hypothetical protein [Coprococcus catus]
MAATVIRINNCTVRIHGELDAEKLRATTETFLKKVERMKRNGTNETAEGQIHRCG